MKFIEFHKYWYSYLSFIKLKVLHDTLLTHTILHGACLIYYNCSNTHLTKNCTDLKAPYLINYFFLIIFSLGLDWAGPSNPARIQP